jgi:hypothetical protein
MEAKEFRENCQGVFSFFNGVINSYWNLSEGSLRSFIFEGTDKIHTVLLDEKASEKEEFEDLLYEFGEYQMLAAFGIGFVLGQDVDVTNSEFNKYLNAIRKTLKKKQLLPYLPRERERRAV